jgi:MscS family membrane protein
MERAGDRAAGGARELQGVVLKALARASTVMCFTLALWFGLAMLLLPEAARGVADTVTRVLYAAAVGYAIYCLVDVIDYYLGRVSSRTESKVDDMLAPLVGKSVRITVLVLVVLQVVQALSDKPMTSIIAGLGVGGLAIALAGQDAIKNFFGSLVIVADKPFEMGDRIVVDGHDGPVEKVGFRSTKVRTLDGHLVTIPNAEIMNRTIQNVGQRPYIKRVANITITYDTPAEKVREAVDILKAILDNHEGMDEEFPPRVYFSGFNDCSLNLMMLYWYHPPDYWMYMAFSERVNQEILRRFNEAGIEFAFPTRTLYLANDDRRQLALQMLRDET